MAYLDRGIGEAYVSPQIEATLGFSQQEWLEDPVRWYRQIHPDDKERWSMEAAGDVPFGRAPAIRVSRDGARRPRGLVSLRGPAGAARGRASPGSFTAWGSTSPSSSRLQEALQEERNVVSAIFDTVGALVVVLDREGRIVRFNRACEQMTGYSVEESGGTCGLGSIRRAEEGRAFRELFFQIRDNPSRHRV